MQLTKQERIKKYGEVFTPQWVVAQMCDNLPDDAFLPEKTFLEPTCGDGVFLLEILRRKFEHCRIRTDFTTAIRSVWGMDIQADNVDASIKNVEALCREYFKPTKDDLQIIRDHIIMADSLKVMRMISELNERSS